MKKDRYISTKSWVSGFSFANLGLFTGFGVGIANAVYPLILFEIFKSGAVVGLYSSVFNAFGLIVALFIGQLLRMFSKSKLFYASMLTVAICFGMMGFSIRPGTFIALDFTVLIPLVLISALIPLFMSDFADKDGIAKLQGRHNMWRNTGLLFAPMIAMFLADNFGMRSAFFASSLMFLLGWYLFKHYKIVQEEKVIPKLYPRKTLRSIIRETKKYFARAPLRRAYMVNFGFFALKALRVLYVPIVVMEAGFSKEALGLVLSLGALPYIILSEPIGRLAKRFGQGFTKAGLAFGFITFSAAAFMLYFADGITMLTLFVLWQISGAVMESLHILLFFNVAKKEEHGRFFGIFNTSMNLPRFLTPLVAAAFIVVFGATRAVWLAAGVIGIVSTIILLSAPRSGKMTSKKDA